MIATQQLSRLGQSLWLDDIGRDLLDSGTFARYVSEYSVTGLTSNPTILDGAISHSDSYDVQIGSLRSSGFSGEDLLFALALDDLLRAADELWPTYRRTAGVDGWVSLEVSPLLAHDARQTLAAARALHARAGKPNLMIKIPGTREGLTAIEDAIFSGIPVNVTLLFSPEQYLNAADAYLTGLERRVDAGLSPDVRSVASLFISRWDRAVAQHIPAALNNRLGIAIGSVAYKAYRDHLESDRWQRLANLGARPQRLLFASTGSKDPAAPDTQYIEALAAPHTVNTMPERTLLAMADHGSSPQALPRDGLAGALSLTRFERAGIDLQALADRLQADGEAAFVHSWHELLDAVARKCAALSPGVAPSREIRT